MALWFYKNLGDASLATESLHAIRQLFIQHSHSPDRPRRLYLRHVSEGRLHCELFLYFSPEATELALLLKAMPCPEPDESELDLMIRDEAR